MSRALIFILLVLILVCMTKIFQKETFVGKGCLSPPCKNYGDVCSDTWQCTRPMICKEYTGSLISDHTAHCLYP